MKTLSSPDWHKLLDTVRDGGGEEAIARRIGVSVRDLVDAIYPGTSEANIEKIHDFLNGGRVQPVHQSKARKQPTHRTKKPAGDLF